MECIFGGVVWGDFRDIDKGNVVYYKDDFWVFFEKWEEFFCKLDGSKDVYFEYVFKFFIGMF